MKIAFYKKSKTLFGRLICLKQRLTGMPERYAQYSHVEIIFSDWIAFSSSEVDGWVRFKEIDWNTENWDFIEINISQKREAKIRNFCNKEIWNRYNKTGIFFAQILNFNKKKHWTWFCSEIVTRALQEASMLCTTDSLFTKPWELAMILEKYYTLEDNYER